MSTLINLNDARKKLNELEGSAEYNKGVTDAFNALFDLPIIEAEPIKHGRNIADGYIDHTRENKHARIFLCSECRYGFDDIYLANERDYPIEPNYCPNCGAKMDEVGE